MSPLLAQVRNNNANNGPPPEFFVVLFVILGIALLVGLIINIFFLLTLSKALSRCSPRNRIMEPGQVWLNLIPFFSLVWIFITVNRISESLSNEYYDRGWDRGGEDYGKNVGLTYCIMILLSIIPYCGSIFGLVGLVCFILYWVKIAGFSARLASRADYDDDYDDDDRPRRRRRDDDDDRRRDDDDDDDDRPRRR
jgi:ABC-type antimicrobial peptide transport system permease subunit